MDTPPWTDEHSQAIAAATPHVPELTDAELDRTWATVRAGMRAPAAPRRSRARMLLAAALAAATVAVGGVAAAEIYSARTGKGPVDAEDLRLGGPGERLDPSAADFGTVIDEETTDVPFPSKETREISRERLVSLYGNDPRGYSGVSTGALRFWTARDAVCAWSNQWALATEAGDDPARAKAAAMLVAAPDWPAVTDVDPRQRIVFQPSETMPDNTPAGYFPLVREAVQDGDADELGRILSFWGVCGGLVPDFPQAHAPITGPWRP